MGENTGSFGNDEKKPDSTESEANAARIVEAVAVVAVVEATILPPYANTSLKADAMT
jgi:hypothetical protein